MTTNAENAREAARRSNGEFGHQVKSEPTSGLGTSPATPTVSCPTATHQADGTSHTVVGCGSTNVARDESEDNLYDCLDCGIWFNPTDEDPAPSPDTSAFADFDDQAIAEATARAVETGQPVLVAHPTGNRFSDDTNGSNCGDVSVGTEASVSHMFATGRPDEPFVTFTDIFYVVARIDGDSHDLSAADLGDELDERAEAEDKGHFPPILYAVNSQIQMTVHSDPHDPGMSEIDAEYEYLPGSDRYYFTLAEANDAARAMAKRINPEHYTPENMLTQQH